MPIPAVAILLVPLAAAAASVLLIVVLWPHFERHLLARPNARSSHRKPTPQGGGAAVIAATLAVSILAAAMGAVAAGFVGRLAPVLAATVVMTVVGAADDLRSLAVWPRLLIHLIAVAAIVSALPPELRIISSLPWWTERVLLVIGGLWFVNLVNFMDGIDWMTVAEVVPLTAALVLIGMLGALPPDATLVALGLGGAVIGFAPYNRPVARLFLGDVGSLPIGLLLAWLLILLAGAGHLAAALLLPLYYLADATITLSHRLIAGERVWD